MEKEDGEEYMVKAINQQGSKTCRTQLLVLGGVVWCGVVWCGVVW